MASEPFDMKRLGGPPGLFDAPNRERGGTILRVRVPDAPESSDTFYGIGPLDVPSLNDCDDGRVDNAAEKAKIEESLSTGLPYRKSITGDKM